MPAAKTNPALTQKQEPGQISHSRTICRPVPEIYQFCRDVGNLTRILQDMSVTANGRKGWDMSLAEEPADPVRISIVSDRADKAIAWRCADGKHAHEGKVTFDPAPGDEGTEVTVVLRSIRSGAKIDGEAVAAALRRGKALLEAGEIPTIDGQPVGEPQKSKLKK